MPLVEFEVIVGVSRERSFTEELAIAEASRYLGYADQTDTFGYGASIFAVDVYGSDGREMDWGVGLHFDAPMTSDDRLKAFMDEMANLAHVESVEITGGELP